MIQVIKSFFTTSFADDAETKLVENVLVITMVSASVLAAMFIIL